MVCALYIPEVQFANVLTMEPIVLQYVPHDRFNKVKSGNFGNFRIIPQLLPDLSQPTATPIPLKTEEIPGFARKFLIFHVCLLQIDGI